MKFVSIIALCGNLAIIIMTSDFIDKRPTWAKQFKINQGDPIYK